MRLKAGRLTIPILSLSILILASAASLQAAESTKTFRLEYDARPGTPFAVENLAGSMHVVAGKSDKVVALATVHAEDEKLMSTVRFEQVAGEGGQPTLRVVYPTDDYSKFRFPREGSADESLISRLFGVGDNYVTKYVGKEVRVSSTSGVLLYADVEVQLPSRSVEATFRNLIGQASGQGVEGTLKFDTASGDISLQDVKGDIVADTGSGDVKARDVSGSFKGDTGSGDIDLTKFDGEKISCDTGSGSINLRSVVARKIEADTGSGDIHAVEADTEEFKAATGSGDVELAFEGTRLARVKAGTGSGDVTLRLGPDASFEAMADLGSGDIVSRYSDAQPIRKQKELVGYRRGDGRTRIDVGTGSGDLVLEPGT